jgi:Holliday junction resolvase
MSNQKGDRLERELRDLFRDAGFAVIRVAGSGSSPDDDLPDLFVGDGRRMFAVEVKSSKRDSFIYLDEEDVGNLVGFARGFHNHVVPLIAVRFDYHAWNVRTPIEAFRAYHTDAGNVRVGVDDLDEWASFEELLSGGYPR